MSEEIDDNEKKGMMLFGRDVSKIPCFRNTFLFSISSGIGVGLFHFMFTSKVRKSLNVAMLTYGCTTLGYWFYCRYNYSVAKFKLDQLKQPTRREKSDC